MINTVHDTKDPIAYRDTRPEPKKKVARGRKDYTSRRDHGLRPIEREGLLSLHGVSCKDLARGRVDLVDAIMAIVAVDEKGQFQQNRVMSLAQRYETLLFQYIRQIGANLLQVTPENDTIQMLLDRTEQMRTNAVPHTISELQLIHARLVEIGGAKGGRGAEQLTFLDSRQDRDAQAFLATLDIAGLIAALPTEGTITKVREILDMHGIVFDEIRHNYAQGDMRARESLAATRATQKELREWVKTEKPSALERAPRVEEMLDLYRARTALTLESERASKPLAEFVEPCMMLFGEGNNQKPYLTPSDIAEALELTPKETGAVIDLLYAQRRMTTLRTNDDQDVLLCADDHRLKYTPATLVSMLHPSYFDRLGTAIYEECKMRGSFDVKELLRQTRIVADIGPGAITRVMFEGFERMGVVSGKPLYKLSRHYTDRTPGFYVFESMMHALTCVEVGDPEPIASRDRPSEQAKRIALDSLAGAGWSVPIIHEQMEEGEELHRLHLDRLLAGSPMTEGEVLDIEALKERIKENLTDPAHTVIVVSNLIYGSFVHLGSNKRLPARNLSTQLEMAREFIEWIKSLGVRRIILDLDETDLNNVKDYAIEVIYRYIQAMKEQQEQLGTVQVSGFSRWTGSMSFWDVAHVGSLDVFNAHMKRIYRSAMLYMYLTGQPFSSREENLSTVGIDEDGYILFVRAQNILNRAFEEAQGNPIDARQILDAQLPEALRVLNVDCIPWKGNPEPLGVTLTRKHELHVKQGEETTHIMRHEGDGPKGANPFGQLEKYRQSRIVRNEHPVDSNNRRIPVLTTINANGAIVSANDEFNPLIALPAIHIPDPYKLNRMGAKHHAWIGPKHLKGETGDAGAMEYWYDEKGALHVTNHQSSDQLSRVSTPYFIQPIHDIHIFAEDTLEHMYAMNLDRIRGRLRQGKVILLFNGDIIDGAGIYPNQNSGKVDHQIAFHRHLLRYIFANLTPSERMNLELVAIAEGNHEWGIGEGRTNSQVTGVSYLGHIQEVMHELFPDARITTAATGKKTSGTNVYTASHLEIPDITSDGGKNSINAFMTHVAMKNGGGLPISGSRKLMRTISGMTNRHVDLAIAAHYHCLQTEFTDKTIHHMGGTMQRGNNHTLDLGVNSGLGSSEIVLRPGKPAEVIYYTEKFFINYQPEPGSPISPEKLLSQKPGAAHVFDEYSDDPELDRSSTLGFAKVVTSAQDRTVRGVMSGLAKMTTNARFEIENSAQTDRSSSLFVER